MVSFVWYGTNSIKLSCNGNSIIFDPFIRYDKKKDKKFVNNLICNDVFLTHNHIDHASDIKNIYKNNESNIYCTSTPYLYFLKKNVKNIKLISYGDWIKLNNFKVKVYKSKHIKFDLRIIFKTMFNIRIIKYFNNLIDIIKKNFIFKENDETVLFYVEVDNKKILVMGSMNLDYKINYPKEVDYLFLAFQGRSDLEKQVKYILDTLRPKCIVLTHFDDSFPPVSSRVNLDKIKKMDINLVIPTLDREINLD